VPVVEMDFQIVEGDRDMCCDLLRKKYLRGKCFFGSNHRGASQFWKWLHEAKFYYQKGIKHILGDGNKIRFWHEVWLGECTLRIKYGKLFNICHQQEWEVSRVLESGQINLTFRRNFDAPEWREWAELESELANIKLTAEEDSLKWALTSHGQFTVHSLYSLDFPWG
jgi:hypothetical protein